MEYRLLTLVLVLATLGFAQPQGQTPPTSPPYTTPPTFPEGQQDPRQQMPPDQEAPPPKRSSTKEVEQQIQQGLNSEPALSNANVSVKVDESSAVLTGTVNSEEQHDLAVRIAQPYVGDRKIVDKIKVRKQT